MTAPDVARIAAGNQLLRPRFRLPRDPRRASHRLPRVVSGVGYDARIDKYSEGVRFVGRMIEGGGTGNGNCRTVAGNTANGTGRGVAQLVSAESIARSAIVRGNVMVDPFGDAGLARL